MDQDAQRKLAAHLFAQREEDFAHNSFDREIAFYESICSGDIDLVRVFSTPLCGEGYGTLSADPLRNLKYHFVVSTAMVARFCIKSGMTPETAYQLSDYYILRADECRTEEGVHSIHTEMVEGYTRSMRRVNNSRIYSKQIVRALDYISEHIHSRILLHDAAAHLKISEAYLSRLFKSETGMPFSEYINRKKIETAACLLRYSDYSDLDISNFLAFSSQSYFIKLFRQYMGMTPRAYRKSASMPDLTVTV